MASDKLPSSIMSPTKIEDSLPSPPPDQATAELSQVIDDLLNQLSAKFNSVSEELLSKMDDMSKRLDSLEAAIQAGKSGDGK